MVGMIRAFRLTNEPGGLGLSCSSTGLSLAGVPLLHKTGAGFVPRPAAEITKLVKAAYGADPTGLQSSLGAIAEAINGGALARAMITAVQTRTPELSFEAAARLATAEQKLAKYNRDEPRDWHGRWIRDGGTGGSPNVEPPAGGRPPIQVADASGPHVSDAEQGDGLLAPAALSDHDTDGDLSREPNSLEQAFERQYDDLGPVEFAKQVIQFGDLLGRQGKNLSPAEKEHALAEYSFLQDRLSFWLAYDYKPPKAQANLLSAALTLYQGAINGGVVEVGHLPQSMLDVASASGWTSGSAPPRIRPSTSELFAKPSPERPVVEQPSNEEPPQPAARLKPRAEKEELGGTVDNSEVGIEWNNGIKDQGIPFQVYAGKQNPDATVLLPTSKTFDQFDKITGEAISAKTLNTLSVSYINDPQMIYRKLKVYVNAAVNYKPRLDTDVDARDIASKTIQIAIPEYTSPKQWRYLFAAIFYGKERRVRIVITRIRE
jgi:hypothetical protein